MKAAVIVPTNRPARAHEFIEAWGPQFNRPDVRLIVVEDSLHHTFDVPDWVEFRCHSDMMDLLGDKADCIPTKSGGCRDFGFYLAGKDKTVDMIVSLDDDVLPLKGVDFLAEHWQALETPRSLKWWQPFPGFRLRGEPYHPETVKPMLNLGLWQGFPDVDAFGQLSEPACEERFAGCCQPDEPSLIPPGMYFPCCGMNFAVRREAAPFVYFPRLPEGMKRFDDIWMGLIFKRIADLFGWGVTCGTPLLKHDRASNPLSNLKQEMLGYGLNEELWEMLDNSPKWSHMTPLAVYSAQMHNIGEAFRPLREMARHAETWASLWEEPITTTNAGEDGYVWASPPASFGPLGRTTRLVQGGE